MKPIISHDRHVTCNFPKIALNKVAYFHIPYTMCSIALRRKPLMWLSPHKLHGHHVCIGR